MKRNIPRHTFIKFGREVDYVNAAGSSHFSGDAFLEHLVFIHHFWSKNYFVSVQCCTKNYFVSVQCCTKNYFVSVQCCTHHTSCDERGPF